MKEHKSKLIVVIVAMILKFNSYIKSSNEDWFSIVRLIWLSHSKENFIFLTIIYN